MKKTWIAIVLAVACIAPAMADGPALARIAAAQATVVQHPAQADAHVALAMAYAERARETADTAFYRKAHVELDEALRHAPDDFAAQRARAWVWLGMHEFQQALDLATALNKRQPDDVMTYGMLVDANMELGHYEAAERAAQWMLDLRPGNVAGLTRAAYVREMIGDIEGGIDLMRQAYERTPAAETEHRAWIVTQLAHLQLARAQPERAMQLADDALALLPGYHYALLQRARAATALGDHTLAAQVHRQHVEAAPHPENIFELAVALKQAGLSREAQSAFDQFEQRALLESEKRDNANHELVRYYTDHADDPGRAVAIAKREMAHRQDVATRDGYAWALFRAGDAEQAGKILAPALSLGTANAAIRYHAGLILAAQGRPDEARKHLRMALESAPWHPLAAEARALLDPVSAKQGART